MDTQFLKKKINREFTYSFKILWENSYTTSSDAKCSSVLAKSLLQHNQRDKNKCFSDEELMLETSAFSISLDFAVAILPLVINSFDKPKICFYSPQTQHHSFFRN